MGADTKRYTFYLGETGEQIETVSIQDDGNLDDKLNDLRLQLALKKGIEANSIEYKEV